MLYPITFLSCCLISCYCTEKLYMLKVRHVICYVQYMYGIFCNETQGFMPYFTQYACLVSPDLA